MKKIFSFLLCGVMLASFTACEKEAEVSNQHNGHEFVDLGLPSGLKWATCNIGATTPEGFGDYFAWGEIIPNKTIYDWSKYGEYTWGVKTDEAPNYGMLKYNHRDDKTTLTKEDDAACVHWGGNWRTPTKNEMNELVNECTRNLISQNGVLGYQFVGPNGNSIFLPFAGYYFYDIYMPDEGDYWSSTLDSEDCFKAVTLLLDQDWSSPLRSQRCDGLTIRPVCFE